jgi:hypothetical protein
MKFKYYITNLFDGCVQGTDDDDVAADLAECEEYFVVDSEAGEWLAVGGERRDITE